jgi:hypothetical protein
MSNDNNKKPKPTTSQPVYYRTVSDEQTQFTYTQIPGYVYNPDGTITKFNGDVTADEPTPPIPLPSPSSTHCNYCGQEVNDTSGRVERIKRLNGDDYVWHYRCYEEAIAEVIIPIRLT